MVALNASDVVLVTGATGRHGGTGMHVVRRLRESGVTVRALVRRLDDRVNVLSDLGAEIVVGDLCDRISLVPALDGVSSVYFTYPINAGVVQAAANYVAAVREVGVSPHTVVMSMGPAHPQNPSHLGRAQWLAEEVLEWAHLDRTVLRVAGLFHENLQLLHGRSVRTDNVIRNSFGRVSIGWINGLDAAELGIAALLYPERFEGETVHLLPGTEALAHDEIAVILGELVGRKIDFVPLEREEWRAELEELSVIDPGSPVNKHMAQHISAVGAALAAQGGPRLPADSDLFKRLTGRTAVSLRDYLTANVKQFS